MCRRIDIITEKYRYCYNPEESFLCKVYNSRPKKEGFNTTPCNEKTSNLNEIQSVTRGLKRLLTYSFFLLLPRGGVCYLHIHKYLT